MGLALYVFGIDGEGIVVGVVLWNGGIGGVVYLGSPRVAQGEWGATSLRP